MIPPCCDPTFRWWKKGLQIVVDFGEISGLKCYLREN